MLKTRCQLWTRREVQRDTSKRLLCALPAGDADGTDPAPFGPDWQLLLNLPRLPQRPSLRQQTRCIHHQKTSDARLGPWSNS